MRGRNRAGRRRDEESGMTLVMVALALVVILGASALAIDLVSFYVARSEAQRAADGAALAGAEAFLTTGFTGSPVSSSAVQAEATAQAIDVANKNLVGGRSPGVVPADVSFDFSKPSNPRITVTVARDTAHGNPMPTFFAKIFGITAVNVSASATAEAYNPTGLPFFTKCFKPWVLPNCDPNHSSPVSSSCTTGGEFIDPRTGVIPNPGLAPGGVVGSTLTLQPGDPSKPAGANLYYPADPSAVNQGLIECPSCGDPSFTYENNLKCCNLNQWTCGAQNLPPYPAGTKIGETAEGMECLINAPGQDTLIFDPTNASAPFTVMGGSSNPNPDLRGKRFMFPPSSSIVNVPLIAPGIYCPNGPCSLSETVNLVGFMQIFINDAKPSGEVDATVLNVTKCPSGPPPGQGAPDSGYTIIPVRLVQP